MTDEEISTTVARLEERIVNLRDRLKAIEQRFWAAAVALIAILVNAAKDFIQ